MYFNIVNGFMYLVNTIDEESRNLRHIYHGIVVQQEGTHKRSVSGPNGTGGS